MSTMKRILISQSNDLVRVARTDGQILFDLEIESNEHDQKVDSICNGEIVSIEPSLEAAFVNFGSKRNGFLPLKEIAPEYYPNGQYNRDMSIKDILFIGQKVLVQVVKEERGTKGAALSTFISLAGSYLVLMPNNPKAGGISRRIEGEEREELREILNSLTIPEDVGVIIRTAGMGRSSEELQWDLNVLLHLWESIKRASKAYGAPYLIHQESDIAIRAIRDHLRQDISEIIVDDKELYEKVLAYIERVRPSFTECVKHYTDTIPLFSRFQLEKQIETAFQRNVRLPSGGQIVIDYTEALITIDINSAQSTKGGYIEETALNTNLEAADEIAKQLRLRDLGGLIVIDFIDMEREENSRKVEDRLREALKTDRARVQISHISRFGLLEMSRQRLKPLLNEATLIPCPRCHGQGSIRNIKSLALSIIHLIEEHAVQPNTTQVQVQVPIELATYILNEFRNAINSIEQNHHVSILILPNPHMETPKYEIERISGGERIASDRTTSSYEIVKPPVTSTYQAPAAEPIIEKRKPIVTEALPDLPAPIVARKKKILEGEGFFKRLLKRLFGQKTKEGPIAQEPDPRQRNRRSSRGPVRHSNDRKRPFDKNARRPRSNAMRRHSRNDRNERGERIERNDGASPSRKRDNFPPKRAGRPYEPSREAAKSSSIIVETYQPQSQQQVAPQPAPAPKPIPMPREPSKPVEQSRPVERTLPEHATQINISPRRESDPSGLIMVETNKHE